ncbi:hypothetical protein E3P91_00424 [Wallemia ichthyophaga]|nr:hypothetical protein E3P91_00424 [Wallemia ichthyophaga]
MRPSLARHTQSTLESIEGILSKSPTHTNPSIQDLESLRPRQLPTQLQDKIILYDTVHKRLDNAFTKSQLRHLIKELEMQPGSNLNKRGLVDRLLSRWGVYSQQHLTKVSQQETLRRSEAKHTIALPSHALFLLLGQDGQQQHRLISSPFNVRVGVVRVPKLALSIVGSNECVGRATEFLDRFVRNTQSASVHVPDAVKRLSKSALLGISRITHTYLDPASLGSDMVVMYAHHQRNLTLATRLLNSHLRRDRRGCEAVKTLLPALALNAQRSLTLLPFELRDERPWDLVGMAYQLGLQLDGSDNSMSHMQHDLNILTPDDLFNGCETLRHFNSDSDSALVNEENANKEVRVEIELGHYLYLDQHDTSGYTAKADVDVTSLPTPRFVPSVNPASLKIPLKGADYSPQLRLTYTAGGEGTREGTQRQFTTLLSTASDGQPSLHQSISAVSIEGLVLPGLPTDARVSRYTRSESSLLGLDVELRRWIEGVSMGESLSENGNGNEIEDASASLNASYGSNILPPLALTDEHGTQWYLDEHSLLNSNSSSKDNTIAPGVTLTRESVLDGETNETHECARISLSLEGIQGCTVDRECRTRMHSLLTQKWSFVYDHMRWSRPPREYQSEKENEQENEHENEHTYKHNDDE